MTGFLQLQKTSGGIMDAFDPLAPEIVDSEAFLPSDVTAPSEISEKVRVCCRGFSEADWNACVCNAVQYNDESDDDFDLAVHIRHKNTKNNRKCKWVPRGSRRNGFV